MGTGPRSIRASMFLAFLGAQRRRTPATCRLPRRPWRTARRRSTLSRPRCSRRCGAPCVEAMLDRLPNRFECLTTHATMHKVSAQLGSGAAAGSLASRRTTSARAGATLVAAWPPPPPARSRKDVNAHGHVNECANLAPPAVRVGTQSQRNWPTQASILILTHAPGFVGASTQPSCQVPGRTCGCGIRSTSSRMSKTHPPASKGATWGC